MEAVLLAGGFGTRLLPITRTRPKVMVPLLNKPMIEHIIDALPPEVDRIIFSVGHQFEPIKEYFEAKNDREYLFFVEEEPLGTGGGIKNCEEAIDGAFLAMNTDGITNLNISDLINFHKEKNGMATITLWTVEDPEPYGIVAMDEQNRINAFVEKPKREEAPSNLASAGIYILEKEVLDTMPDSTKVSIERETFPSLIPNLYGYPYNGYYLDAGNHHAYLATQHQLLLSRDRQMVLGGSSETRGRLGENVCLGNMVELATNTFVANSTVLNSVIVDEGTEIRGSIIGENCNIGKRVRINDSIIGDDVTILDGITLNGAKIEPRSTVSEAIE